ncbi:membrane protein [Pedobacter lusitanus]|uniref:Membrane protein n=1 Tax=Pedobacter lusitanus TaxID=1503925 RepID=A0A0D0GMY9_9SPHI|nr:membrane protein [Pedobacter lusitanus]
MFFNCLQASAALYAQKITLTEKNTPLGEVIKKIKKQSGYSFFYRDQLFKASHPVTITIKDATITEALDKCLDNQPLTYSLIGQTIVLKQKTETRQKPEPETAGIDVRGKVLDETNQPLLGATVKVKGTTQVTSTNPKGEFMLKNVAEDAVLVISYIGYLPKEIMAAQNLGDIQLVLSAAKLGEVLIVGYGTQKKVNLIGSVAQVSAKDINNRTAPSLSNVLTGQLSGVTLIQRSGQPGSDASAIQIRGVGSFGATTNPLILVDGIPVNSFNDIDANDVSSISVLKDASTAAIYGSRGANGVVLVTTKTGMGTDEKLHINYSGYAGIQKPTAYPKFVNAADYASLLNEAVPNSYTADQIEKFRNGSDPDNYPNTNWIDLVYKKSALQTGHNLSVSNNTKNTQYLLSFGYMYQNGIVIKNDYNRYNVRLNMTNKILPNLSLTSRISGAQYLNNEAAPPATLDWNDMLTNIGQVIRVPSVYPNILSNGNYGLGVVGKGTPYSYFNNDSFYKKKQADLLINERLDYNIIPDLKLSLIAAYTQLNDNSQRFLANQRLNNLVTLGPGNLTQENIQNNYKTLQQLLEYKKTLQSHQFGILAGHTYEYSGSNTFRASRGGYITNSLTQLNAGDASTQSNQGTGSEYALDSYFGRLNYNYDNKYLVEGTVRYDGSSRFPENNKYATFPAVAVGWRISQEKFLKDKLSWLNELKIKASYGTLGNQNIGNYSYQNVLSTGFNYPFGNTINSGVANTTLVNSNIHWESTRTKDLGLETTVFNNLNFSATYFDRYTYDILVAPAGSVSKVLGFGVGVENSGKLSNKGWEFSLSYKNNIGALSYNVSGNFSIINNKVLDLGVGNILQPNGLTGNGSDIFIGYPLGLYYGYQADGLFRDAADIAGYPNQTAINPAAKPGDIRYRDISGPNGVPDGKVDPAYDRTYLGSSIPKYNYGINIGLNYKNFDLAIVGQGVAQVKGRLSDYAGYAFYNYGSIQQYMADNHWSANNPDPNARYPRLEVISNSGTPNTLASSFYLLNAAYFKIRSIQLGYALPSALFTKSGIKGIRINISSQNPLAFSHYPKGWDPETNTGGAYYPILTNYTLGINVNL